MNTNPAEVLTASQPHQPTREQTEKVLQDKYPGHIAWATDRASFSGCRALTFEVGNVFGLEPEDAAVFREQVDKAGLLLTGAPRPYEHLASAADLLNLYFSTRANLLVVQMGYGAVGEISLLVTTQLDEEDLEDFAAVQQLNQVAMREARAKRQERYAERRKAELEDKRLAEVGRKYEANLKHNLPKEKPDAAEAKPD